MTAMAHKKVLVLNKKWTAIGVVTLQRAIIMLFSTHAATGGPKAEIVDENCNPWTWEEWSLLKPGDGEENIKSVTGVFRIPEIIKLNGYDRIPAQKVHFSRRTLYKRDGYKCQYCGYRCPQNKRGDEDELAELSIDHIVPRSQGGETTWENCVIACVECNTIKANKFPEEVRHKKYPHGMPRPHPKRPRYNWFRGDIHYNSWRQWIDVNYWHQELINDNKE